MHVHVREFKGVISCIFYHFISPDDIWNSSQGFVCHNLVFNDNFPFSPWPLQQQ